MFEAGKRPTTFDSGTSYKRKIGPVFLNWHIT